MPAPFQGLGEKKERTANSEANLWHCDIAVVIHLLACRTEADNMGNQSRPCYRFDHIACATSPTKILRLLLLSGSHAGGSRAHLNRTCSLPFWKIDLGDFFLSPTLHHGLILVRFWACDSLLGHLRRHHLVVIEAEWAAGQPQFSLLRRKTRCRQNLSPRSQLPHMFSCSHPFSSGL